MTMAEKMHATISYLREAAKQLNDAADRLEAQDGWHLHHSSHLIECAVKNAELSKRQIGRALKANAETQKAYSNHPAYGRE